ncbi:hypothetical protein GY45DRAFT_1331097 [Cubamyces sp. BRFM 1775]|nr:hypothetical protein GY45DRAFT_1331097 [Cubamyces sp. BRFM 1775]
MDTLTSMCSDVYKLNPSLVLPVLMVLGTDVLRRAQAIPDISPLTVGWPEFLLTLLARARPDLQVEPPCTVINAKSGYARTNRSPVLEHLLRSHTDDSARSGLTVTFLTTSQRPGTISFDKVSYTASAATIGQLGLAAILPVLGKGSENVFKATLAGTLLSNAASYLLRHHQHNQIRSARETPEKRRDITCVTSGNGSAAAVVIISEGGGVRIEDLAAGRTNGLGLGSTLAIVVLIALWAVLLLALTALDRVDAWWMLAQCGIGAAYTVFAARQWRGGAAMGFKFSEEKKKVVRADKVMAALMKAEEIEPGVGSTLLPIYFPGPLRPDEELWWAERKQAPKAAL